MPQSSSVNPNRGRYSATGTGGSSADLIYNVRKHQRLQQQDYAGRGPTTSTASTGPGASHSLNRPTRWSSSRTPSSQVIMSRSASQAASAASHHNYAAPTASSRSHQHPNLTASRSLSRSHEERSPRTGRRVVQTAHTPHTNKNSLNRSAVAAVGHSNQYHHTVQVQPVVVPQQQPTPHSSPSRNALAASISAQVGFHDICISFFLSRM